MAQPILLVMRAGLAKCRHKLGFMPVSGKNWFMPVFTGINWHKLAQISKWQHKNMWGFSSNLLAFHFVGNFTILLNKCANNFLPGFGKNCYTVDNNHIRTADLYLTEDAQTHRWLIYHSNFKFCPKVHSIFSECCFLTLQKWHKLICMLCFCQFMPVGGIN